MNPGHALYVSIPSPRQIRMTRTFDAPRHLVFDAFTQPELIRRWIGRPGDEMIVCEVDLRVDGEYRYEFRLRRSAATIHDASTRAESSSDASR